MYFCTILLSSVYLINILPSWPNSPGVSPNPIPVSPLPYQPSDPLYGTPKTFLCNQYHNVIIYARNGKWSSRNIAEFVKGNFSVTKGIAGFTSIGPDNRILQNNHELKVVGGIVGITQNENSLNKYILIAPELLELYCLVTEAHVWTTCLRLLRSFCPE